MKKIFSLVLCIGLLGKMQIVSTVHTDHRPIRHRELLEAHQAVNFSFVPAADAAGTSMTKGDWTLKPKRERK